MAFYKKDQDAFLKGEWVEGDGFSLNPATKEDYTYPVGGWYWFDTDQEAVNAGLYDQRMIQ